jgi:hypothetical protein
MVRSSVRLITTEIVTALVLRQQANACSETQVADSGHRQRSRPVSGDNAVKGKARRRRRRTAHARRKVYQNDSGPD